MPCTPHLHTCAIRTSSPGSSANSASSSSSSVVRSLWCLATRATSCQEPDHIMGKFTWPITDCHAKVEVQGRRQNTAYVLTLTLQHPVSFCRNMCLEGLRKQHIASLVFGSLSILLDVLIFWVTHCILFYCHRNGAHACSISLL